MRLEFIAGLRERLSGKDLEFIKHQNGLFSFFGLTSDQVVRLRDEFAIYMPKNGRINVAGLTTKNIDYVMDAIATVMLI
jgi:aspartate aminotransferase